MIYIFTATRYFYFAIFRCINATLLILTNVYLHVFIFEYNE